MFKVVAFLILFFSAQSFANQACSNKYKVYYSSFKLGVWSIEGKFEDRANCNFEIASCEVDQLFDILRKNKKIGKKRLPSDDKIKIIHPESKEHIVVDSKKRVFLNDAEISVSETELSKALDLLKIRASVEVGKTKEMCEEKSIKNK